VVLLWFRRDLYGDKLNTSGYMFAMECKEAFESLNDMQSIANTMLSFANRYSQHNILIKTLYYSMYERDIDSLLCDWTWSTAKAYICSISK